MSTILNNFFHLIIQDFLDNPSDSSNAISSEVFVTILVLICGILITVVLYLVRIFLFKLFKKHFKSLLLTLLLNVLK